jgi:hypothetical protein
LAAGSAAQAVSVPLHGLAARQLYHYRLVARNSNGISRGADRTFTTRAARRARLRPGLSIRTTPRRDRRRRFRFRVRGRLIPPAGITRSRACRGKVTVRFRAGRKTIVLRQVRVSRRCRFGTRVRLRGRQRRHSTYKVTAHFLGNPVLKPRSTRRQIVRVG